MASLLNFLRYIYQYFYPSFSTQSPPPYIFPSPTKEDLDFADLAIIDLSKAKTREGREELAKQVTKAFHNEGFFYVINHGYTQEQTNRMFSIGNLLFDNVSIEDKNKYQSTSPEVYEGYKLKQLWNIAGGVKDQIEHYNFHRNIYKKSHPDIVRPYLKDLDHFARHCHFNVLHPILRIMAIGLGLPEETLVKQHDFDAQGETSARFMKYYPRTAADEAATKNVWLKGHTDIGSVTILWSQPVGGLQIFSKDGQWKWIRHMDNALVINSGDVLGFLCGGYYPPTIHRVTQPPVDQGGLARLGAFYFSMPNDNTPLAPHKESPVLQEQGIPAEYDPDVAPIMEVWRKSRAKSYGQVELKQSNTEQNVETETIAGLVVKHWN